MALPRPVPAAGDEDAFGVEKIGTEHEPQSYWEYGR